MHPSLGIPALHVSVALVSSFLEKAVCGISGVMLISAI